MITTRWIEDRRPHWGRVEALLSAARRGGVRSLSHRDLRDLALLYRQIAADLSRTREDPTGRRHAVYLNDLLARAHNVIYTGRRSGPGGVVRFYRSVFPRVFRATFPSSAAAFLLFAVAGVAGWLTTLGDPSFQRFVLGGHMVDTIERREMWTHSILAVKPLASSAIATNNLSVCFTTAAAGVTAGAGTILLLVYNGLLLGVIGAACWSAGMSLPFWSFVAPHGVLELPAIFISGGAGILMGRAILFPGLLPRRAALARAGGQSIRLVLGVIPLLLAAGILEAFVSPTSLPFPLKLCVAAAGAALLALYLGAAGRAVDPDDAPPD